MRTAGIREARQNLSKLIAEVAQGHEIIITDRGRPVARLVEPNPPARRGLPDLSAVRKSLPVFDPPVSEWIIRERDERR